MRLYRVEMTDFHDLSARLSQFVPRWQAAQNHDPRLARLDQFVRSYRALRPVPRPAQTRVEPDIGRLTAFLGDVIKPLAEHRASGSVINPWAVAGLKRAEVRNAGVLAMLFSPSACGDVGTAFFDHFCRRIPDPEGLLPSTAELQAGYSVRTEHCPVGERTERVDLTIEGRTFVMGIEVKIDAPEGREQLRRYTSAVKRWGRQRHKRSVVVFLAPYPPREPGVLFAKWSDVRAAGRAITPRRNSELNLHGHLLESFVRHISRFGE